MVYLLTLLQQHQTSPGRWAQGFTPVDTQIGWAMVGAMGGNRVSASDERRDLKRHD